MCNNYANLALFHNELVLYNKSSYMRVWSRLLHDPPHPRKSYTRRGTAKILILLVADRNGASVCKVISKNTYENKEELPEKSGKRTSRRSKVAQ